MQREEQKTTKTIRGQTEQAPWDIQTHRKMKLGGEKRAVLRGHSTAGCWWSSSIFLLPSHPRKQISPSVLRSPCNRYSRDKLRTCSIFQEIRPHSTPRLSYLLGGVLVWRSFLLASLLSPGLAGSGAAAVILASGWGTGRAASFFTDFSLQDKTAMLTIKLCRYRTQAFSTRTDNCCCTITAESKLISPSCSQYSTPERNLLPLLSIKSPPQRQAARQLSVLEIYSTCQSTNEADCAESLLSLIEVHVFLPWGIPDGNTLQCCAWFLSLYPAPSTWDGDDGDHFGTAQSIPTSALVAGCCSASPAARSHLLLTGEEAAACILK